MLVFGGVYVPDQLFAWHLANLLMHSKSAFPTGCLGGDNFTFQSEHCKVQDISTLSVGCRTGMSSSPPFQTYSQSVLAVPLLIPFCGLAEGLVSVDQESRNLLRSLRCPGNEDWMKLRLVTHHQFDFTMKSRLSLYVYQKYIYSYLYNIYILLYIMYIYIHNKGCGSDFLALHFQAFKAWNKTSHGRENVSVLEISLEPSLEKRVTVNNGWEPLGGCRRSVRIWKTGFPGIAPQTRETHQNNLGNIELSVETWNNRIETLKVY